MSAERNAGVKNNFFDTICRNIRQGIYFCPDLNLPFPHNLFTRQVNGEKVAKSEEDITRYFREYLDGRKQKIDFDLTVKLYRFRISGKYSLCLAAAFFGVTENSSEVTDADISKLRQYLALACSRHEVCRFILVLGSNGTFSPDCSVASDPAVILCEYLEPDIWTHRMPEISCGELTRDFLAHVMPGNYAPKLREEIALWDRTRGNINLTRLKDMLGMTPEQIDDISICYALDELFISGDYAMNKQGFIIPWKEWGNQIPKGYKIQHRCSRSIEVWRRIFYFLWAASLLLPVIAIGVAYCFGIRLPMWLSCGISFTSMLVVKYRWKALLRFKYNIR